MRGFTKILIALCTLFTVCFCLPLAACDGEKLPYEKIGTVNDFLTVEEGKVVNGYGEDVYLRGVNAGGLFVTEHWMTGFAYGSTPSNDNRSITETFIERFGEKKTKKLWKDYRANWWTKADFKICAEMGMNVIRLPFTYMNVDFAAISDYDAAGKNYDFSDLDDFINTAAKYGMYTILDLHGAYGSQNGKDHSGQILPNDGVDFYSNAEMKALTVKLWTALAKHYKNNAAVAAYDILNEPGEQAGLTSKRHWDCFDEIYKGIRSVDEKHIVIMESCWDGANLPQPTDYGWQNCMYSFHHYADSNLSVESHMQSWQNKFKGVEAQNFGLPLQMGEFTAYSSADKWKQTLSLLNEKNWHWTSWTYKVWGNMPWGVVNIRGNNEMKVDAANDSYEEITEKFKALRTSGEYAQKYTFYAEGAEPVTLEEIIKESCAPEESDL